MMWRGVHDMEAHMFIVRLAASLSTALLVAPGCSGGDPPAPLPIRPDPSKATLLIGSRTLAPVRIRDPWRPTFAASDLEIAIDERTVTAWDAASGEARWTAKDAVEGKLTWLAAGRDHVYLTQRPAEPSGKPAATPGPLRVLQCRHSDGSWLPPIDIPTDPAEAGVTEEIDSMLILEGSAAVLSRKLRHQEAAWQRVEWIGYRVTGIDPAGGKVLWTGAYATAGDRPPVGAFLFAPTRPDYAEDYLRPLQPMGEAVLVCAGPLDDILCLEAASGKERWRLPRVWEFDRGFVGPSVWSHFIGRFGMSASDLDIAEGRRTEGFVAPEYAKEVKAKVEAARAAAARRTCAIIAGPIPVPASIRLPAFTPRTGWRIFVGVVRSEAAEWPGYLADCIVYEIDEEGHPAAMAALPRQVNGWESHEVEGGVLFGCPRDAMVRVAASGQSYQGSMLGRTDNVCRVEWYREVPPPEPKAWLSADAATSEVAVTAKHAFRPWGGGWIEKEGDGLYRFPLVRINLADGRAEKIVLTVPFTGEVRLPSANFDRSSVGIHAHGPYLLAVIRLQVVGGALRIVVGGGGKAATVDFDLAAVNGVE
jgi:hypothetical protein